MLTTMSFVVRDRLSAARPSSPFNPPRRKRRSKMNGSIARLVGVLALLATCGLVAVGCGDDDSGSSGGGSDESSAEQRIDDAVETCTSEAQQLGDTVGAALEAACTTVGTSVKQALSRGGEAVDDGLGRTADSCRAGVQLLPAGKAQDALSGLCDAIAAAG
jgi:hypothetical protein